MARVDGFIEQMHELLALLGEVEVRRMFGPRATGARRTPRWSPPSE